MTARDMLEDLGVTIIEVPLVRRQAYWNDPERLLLIGPDASDKTWAEAADIVVLGEKR